VLEQRTPVRAAAPLERKSSVAPTPDNSAATTGAASTHDGGGDESDDEDGVLRRVEFVALLARSRDGDLRPSRDFGCAS
jgi:hypothetical protein